MCWISQISPLVVWYQLSKEMCKWYLWACSCFFLTASETVGIKLLHSIQTAFTKNGLSSQEFSSLDGSFFSYPAAAKYNKDPLCC